MSVRFANPVPPARAGHAKAGRKPFPPALLAAWLVAALLPAGCRRPAGGEKPTLRESLTHAESVYGPLVAVGNHPTPDQFGTGERVAFFSHSDGTIWGLPVFFGTDGAVRICEPPNMTSAKITDTIPPGVTVLGSTNAPTGWRGGTGQLELVLRHADGTLHWKPLASGELPRGVSCFAPMDPGPVQQLHYYRIERSAEPSAAPPSPPESEASAAPAGAPPAG